MSTSTKVRPPGHWRRGRRRHAWYEMANGVSCRPFKRPPPGPGWIRVVRHDDLHVWMRPLGHGKGVAVKVWGPTFQANLGTAELARQEPDGEMSATVRFDAGDSNVFRLWHEPLRFNTSVLLPGRTEWAGPHVVVGLGHFLSRGPGRPPKRRARMPVRLRLAATRPRARWLPRGEGAGLTRPGWSAQHLEGQRIWVYEGHERTGVVSPLYGRWQVHAGPVGDLRYASDHSTYFQALRAAERACGPVLVVNRPTVVPSLPVN